MSACGYRLVEHGRINGGKLILSLIFLITYIYNYCSYILVLLKLFCLSYIYYLYFRTFFAFVEESLGYKHTSLPAMTALPVMLGI